MTDLEIAKARHANYIKKQTEWLKCIAYEYEDCGFDGDIDAEDDLEELLDMIVDGDIQLTGLDDRDGLYLQDILRCNETLIMALQCVCDTEKNVLHTGKIQIESVIRTARAIKSAREEDIRKAKEVIDVMDEIIATCEKIN